MTELGRLLRYAVPGGIFEILVGAWLVLDDHDYLGSVGNDLSEAFSAGAVALLIAAAFPVGYLISVIANEVAWFVRPWSRGRRVWGRIATDRALRAAHRRKNQRRWLKAVRRDLKRGRDKPARPEADEALVELLQRLAHKGQSYKASVERVRAFADLMNGLINSFIAISLALLTAAGSLACTFCLGREAPDESRSILMGLFFVVSVVLLLFLRNAERRVAHITEVFVIGMLEGDRLAR